MTRFAIMANTLTFCDPIHGLIIFRNDEVKPVRQIIEQPEFQRLRYIKQLGLTDLLFPCAVHTRFSHSLGVCYTAKRIYERLTGEASGSLSHEKRVLMQAALLHDIGHGPFSHAFEAFVSRINKDIKHDKHWLGEFLKAFKIGDEVKSVIERRNPNLAYLSDIVSSQLDADRMDYLLRDSHFCGVSYGAFEIEWLMNSLELREVVEDGVSSQRIAVNIKGISALEHFVMARRLMNRYVYTHPHTLGADHLLIEFLCAVADALVNINDHKGELLTTLQMVQRSHLGQLLYALKTESHDGADFAKRYLQPYRDLVDHDIIHAMRQFALLEDKHDVCQLAQRLFHRRIPNYLRLQGEHFQQAEQLVRDYLQSHPHLRPWQITTHRENFESYRKSTKDRIYIIDQAHTVGVDQKSNVLELFGDKVEDTCYLLVDPAAENDIPVLLQQLEKQKCIYQQPRQSKPGKRGEEQMDLF